MSSAAVVIGALRVNYFRVPKSGTVRQVSIVDILRQGQFFSGTFYKKLFQHKS